MQIKKGNQVIIDVAIKDADGELVTDLSTVLQIFYMIKAEATDPDNQALVSLSYTGGDIQIDTPDTGYVRITINPTDTVAVDAGEYYHGLQLNYSATNIQEIWFKTDQGFDSDRIKIVQDVIR
jgi:hypothetical protein